MNATKKDLANRVAELTSCCKEEAKKNTGAVLAAITAMLIEGKRLEIRDFGVLEVVTKAARTARNPRTGEKLEVPAKKKVKFKPGKALAAAVNSDS